MRLMGDSLGDEERITSVVSGGPSLGFTETAGASLSESVVPENVAFEPEMKELCEDGTGRAVRNWAVIGCQ